MSSRNRGDGICSIKVTNLFLSESLLLNEVEYELNCNSTDVQQNPKTSEYYICIIMIMINNGIEYISREINFNIVEVS